MEFLIFALFIGLAIANSASKSKAKKKKEEEQQARNRQAYAPPPTVEEALPSAAFDWEDKPAAPRTFESGSLTYASAEGSGSWSSTDQASLEGVGMGGSLGNSRSPITGQLTTSITHTVKPLTESSHRHMESSLSGNQACPPERIRVRRIPHETAATAVFTASRSQLAFDHGSVVRGVLYAEILGPPKARQGRRGR